AAPDVDHRDDAARAVGHEAGRQQQIAQLGDVTAVNPQLVVPLAAAPIGHGQRPVALVDEREAWRRRRGDRRWCGRRRLWRARQVGRRAGDLLLQERIELGDALEGVAHDAHGLFLVGKDGLQPTLAVALLVVEDARLVARAQPGALLVAQAGLA